MLLRHTAIYMVSKTLPAMAGIITTMLLAPADAGEIRLVGLGALVMMMTTYVAFDWQSLASWASIGTMKLICRPTWPSSSSWPRHRSRRLRRLPAMDRPGGEGLVAIGMLGGIASAWFDFAGRRHLAALAPAKYLRMDLVRAVSVCLLSLAAAYATRSPLAVLAANAAGIALLPAPFAEKGLRSSGAA